METILIVEDDEDLRDSLAELFEERGYAVVAAQNGQDALNRLVAGLVPCLILLDLMLPIVSGWEFRNQQLADPRFAQIPIIILSGIHNLRSEAQRLQAVAFVPKPLDFDRLFKAIDQYC